MPHTRRGKIFPLFLAMGDEPHEGVPEKSGIHSEKGQKGGIHSLDQEDGMPRGPLRTLTKQFQYGEI